MGSSVFEMALESKTLGIIVSAENPERCNYGFLYGSAGESAMKTDRVYRRMTLQLTVISAMALTAVCLLTNPANARWGGGYGGGGGYHYGGDGFGGGDPSYSSRASEYQSRYGSSPSSYAPDIRAIIRSQVPILTIIHVPLTTIPRQAVDLIPTDPTRKATMALISRRASMKRTR